VPHVVERLVALNAPPLPALAAEALRNARQARRSAYVAYFNLPWLPERTLTKDGAAFAARALVGGSYRRGVWPPDELERYREALARPGAAAAALAYYRAAARGLRAERRAFRRHPVSAPTLVVWGLRDRFLGLGTVAPRRLRPLLSPGNEPELRVLPDAGHFVQNEAPGEVNAELLRWLPRLR
jgi:pimeloyl-ACP methyl ester carboxylesterase